MLRRYTRNFRAYHLNLRLFIYHFGVLRCIYMFGIIIIIIWRFIGTSFLLLTRSLAGGIVSLQLSYFYILVLNKLSLLFVKKHFEAFTSAFLIKSKRLLYSSVSHERSARTFIFFYFFENKNIRFNTFIYALERFLENLVVLIVRFYTFIYVLKRIFLKCKKLEIYVLIRLYTF